MNFLHHLFNRFSWRISPLSVLILLAYLCLYPIMNTLGAEWFKEYSTVENMQLAILAVCFLIALHADSDKPLFKTAAMIIVLLIMRETNMGRDYFCAQFLDAGEMCKWKNMRYGYIAEILRALYALAILIYVWKKKVHLIAWRYLKEAPLYVWDLGFLILSAIIGTLAEKPFRCEELEELAETLFYLSLASCLWRYGQSRKSDIDHRDS